MTSKDPQKPGAARRFLPVLLLLFAASGCSALIYEIVWYQLLQLVIGSTAVSLGVLLATFMGGLCVGSLGLPRVARARDMHPLRVYALLELGIGACGILALIVIPLLDRVYVTAVGHGMPAILFRALICAICLMPPTILMGASLPAAARWVESTPEGVSWLGMLYGGNTAGAVFGCLLAGFYLLRVFDLTVATLVAAAINLAVGLSAMALVRKTATATSREDTLPAPAMGPWPIYVAIAISGATALGAEVVWTRLLGLLLGATVYTFSIILAVFLVGIGIGSAAASSLLRGNVRPRIAIGMCQLLLAGAVAWTAWILADYLPYWPVNPLLSTSPAFTFQIDLARTLWTILPATLLWGASFPFALAAVAVHGEDQGRMVGGIYAANTGGAIVGALAFSLVLIPWIGTKGCEQALILLSAVSAVFALAQVVKQSPRMTAALGLSAGLAIAGWFSDKVADVPGNLIAYGRLILLNQGSSKILYTGEGINSSIAISQWNSDGAIQFHVSGKVEASTEPYDMRLQRMLGDMPALFHQGEPHSVLIVGFGAGVTAGSFVPFPGIKRIVICEMEPLIPPTATRYFSKENYNVMNDPRVQIVYDDARHFVLTTDEKFDIITSDPIHPWVKGSATLYSKEYFDLVKQHLNPGGIVTQWVPLYETDTDTVKSEVATFFDAFPNGSIWGNDNNGTGYDTALLGQVEEPKIDVEGIQHRLMTPEYSQVAQSMRDVGFNSILDVLATYAGQRQDLMPWLAGAEINRDGNLRLQYMAGLALNDSLQGPIYSQMLTYRKYPQNMLVVSDLSREDVMHALGGR
ncbi:MAG TPA: fused MFS/spermidine synthase [Bryobacteraceae bacterium]|jgi:spermidine synthase|nr:fused MFS/spermidine synthase [Bryobacteraceae bacterium]